MTAMVLPTKMGSPISRQVRSRLRSAWHQTSCVIRRTIKEHEGLYYDDRQQRRRWADPVVADPGLGRARRTSTTSPSLQGVVQECGGSRTGVDPRESTRE